jgi:CrcB protein
MWKTLLCIAIGGAAGAIARYALSEVVKHATGAGFPWGTLCVNLLGCFLIGLAFHLVTLPAVPSGLKFMIVIGFLGAFTTFSTFSLENINMLRDGEFTRAGLYILVSNVGGIALAFAGFMIGHRIHSAIK